MNTIKYTYGNVNESMMFLCIHSSDLLCLYRYIGNKIQRSPELIYVSSLYQLINEIKEELEKARHDLAHLNKNALNFNEDWKVDTPLPWYFFRVSSLCQAVLNRTHPLVKLYDKYEHLFVDIERTEGYTAYSPKTLF